MERIQKNMYGKAQKGKGQHLWFGPKSVVHCSPPQGHTEVAQGSGPLHQLYRNAHRLIFSFLLWSNLFKFLEFVEKNIST